MLAPLPQRHQHGRHFEGPHEKRCCSTELKLSCWAQDRPGPRAQRRGISSSRTPLERAVLRSWRVSTECPPPQGHRDEPARGLLIAEGALDISVGAHRSWQQRGPSRLRC